MHYPTFWKTLQTVAGLEKLAASDDLAVAGEAQQLLASTCDKLFGTIKGASANIAAPLLELRDSAKGIGEKVASDAEVVGEFMQKLATASFVDDVLSAQLEKLSGAEYDAARSVQLLGREYAVHLMRGLFA
jgi:hypothetical protein